MEDGRAKTDKLTQGRSLDGESSSTGATTRDDLDGEVAGVAAVVFERSARGGGMAGGSG